MHFDRALALTGHNFRDSSGCRVAKSALRRPGVDTLPAGFSIVGGDTIFTQTENATLQGWDLSGFSFHGRGPGGIVLRDCWFNGAVGDAFQNILLDRVLGACPNCIIEHITVDHEKANTGINTVRCSTDNLTIRNSKFVNTGQDCISLGSGPSGNGTVEFNLLGPGGYGNESHCDAISVFGASGTGWLVRRNFIDLRNPGDIQLFTTWPLNNAFRITPTPPPHEIAAPVVFRENVVASRSFIAEVAKTNGYILQDARSSAVAAGFPSVYDGNWADGVFGGASTGSLGLEHPTEPDNLVHHLWRDMFTNASLTSDRNWPWP